MQRARDAQVRGELEQHLAEQTRLRAEEAQRREESERQLAEALAELARLRGEPG